MRRGFTALELEQGELGQRIPSEQLRREAPALPLHPNRGRILHEGVGGHKAAGGINKKTGTDPVGGSGGRRGESHIPVRMNFNDCRFGALIQTGNFSIHCFQCGRSPAGGWQSQKQTGGDRAESPVRNEYWPPHSGQVRQQYDRGHTAEY